jgi:hypothetical protein
MLCGGGQRDMGRRDCIPVPPFPALLIQGVQGYSEMYRILVYSLRHVTDILLPLNRRCALRNETKVITLQGFLSTCWPCGIILKHRPAGTLNSSGIVCVNDIVYMLLPLVKRLL